MTDLIFLGGLLFLIAVLLKEAAQAIARRLK